MRRLTATAAVGAAFALIAGAGSVAAQAPDGQALYQQNCKKCHGATGTPTARIAEMYPEIKPLSQAAGISADSVVALVTNGAGKEMKPFKDKLSPAEIRAVSEYALTLAKPKTP